MLMVNEVTEIFYLSDEFSKEFEISFNNFSFVRIINRCDLMHISSRLLHPN